MENQQPKGVRSHMIYNSNSFDDIGLNPAHLRSPYNDGALSSGTCSQDEDFLEQHQSLSKKDTKKSVSKS